MDRVAIAAMHTDITMNYPERPTDVEAAVNPAPVFVLTPRRLALIAGVCLLLMTVAYFVAEASVFSGMVVADDAIATAQNVVQGETLFRVSILSLLVVLLSDLVAAWAFYLFFKPTSAGLSLLAAWLRLMYTVLLGVGVSFMAHALVFVEKAASPVAADAALPQYLLASDLQAFRLVWGIGLIVFGLHLLVLGYLAYKTPGIPKVFGVLLLLGGLSYPVDEVVRLIFPDVTLPLVMVLGWGELIFAFYLLIAGGRKCASDKETTANGS